MRGRAIAKSSGPRYNFHVTLRGAPALEARAQMPSQQKRPPMTQRARADR
jgi:hypothetical protein